MSPLRRGQPATRGLYFFHCYPDPTEDRVICIVFTLLIKHREFSRYPVSTVTPTEDRVIRIVFTLLIKHREFSRSF